MARYRNISMDFWTDSKVEDDFTPEDRYIYLYCLTNPHTNLCGCYEVSIKQIAHETGYERDAVEKVLRRLDESHDVIRYSAVTRELLVLNWARYNWSRSEKLDKPLLEAIEAVKNDHFREFLMGLYDERRQTGGQEPKQETPKLEKPVSEKKPKDKQPPPEKKVRKKFGDNGWVRLTEAEYDRLLRDLGPAELERCITYLDESAAISHNKNGWKDWNLTIRKCHREGWGLRGDFGKKDGEGRGAAGQHPGPGGTGKKWNIPVTEL